MSSPCACAARTQWLIIGIIVARPGSGVTNQASGQITGASDGIFLGQQSYAPPIYGGATTGTVVNRGTVTATGSNALANGIVLNVATASLDNSGTISLAGGLKEFAKSGDIVVVRVDGAQQATFPFNYDDVKNRKNLAQNILLKPGDTVIVP